MTESSQTPLIYALVNAFKEVSDRLAALEAGAAR
jgi:hypothetical protein